MKSAVRRAVTRSSCRPVVAVTATIGLAGLLSASAAQATPETLRRSVTNIALSPLDLLTSPVVGGKIVFEGLRDIEDTRGVRIVYTVPGYLWATGTNAGASILRGVSGMIEFIPGVLLYPFDTDMNPLMDPVDRGEGLVEWESAVGEIKFGINFQHAAY